MKAFCKKLPLESPRRLKARRSWKDIFELMMLTMPWEPPKNKDSDVRDAGPKQGTPLRDPFKMVSSMPVKS